MLLLTGLRNRAFLVQVPGRAKLAGCFGGRGVGKVPEHPVSTLSKVANPHIGPAMS